MDAMRRHSDVVVVQGSGCGAFLSFDVDARNQGRMMAAGAVDAALDSIRFHGRTSDSPKCKQVVQLFGGIRHLFTEWIREFVQRCTP